jgi:hypothetical protein
MNSATKALLAPPAMRNLHDPSGIGYADTLDPQVPLSVRVGPYLDISEGDVIDLYCDNQRVINYTVKREDLAPGSYNFVVLPLDQKFIRQDSITLLYEVTNPIGGQKNQSVPATIPVKLTLPGGTDTNPATPYENERLAKPKVFPEGVITSPDNVRVEIAPYLNMFVGDKITLSWHGELILTEITDQAQVGQPVVIPVSNETVDLAGDSDMLEVRYEIRDVVNNWSRWSLPIYVEVEAGDASLPVPVTPQAPGMELNLDQLGSADLQVLVIAHPDIQRGDELVLSMERNTAEGIPLETYTAIKTVSTLDSFYAFQVPNAQLQPIAQGRARLKYRVNKPSGNTLRSKSLPLKIVGSPMELPLPRVPAAEQNNGVLNPASRNVQAEVPPYYFMAAGNDVHLFWMGKTDSGANVMHDQLISVVEEDIGSQISFQIPDEKVKPLAGGSVEVYYTVNTFGRAFFRSPSLRLTVSEDPVIPLPLPSIKEVVNDILDPANTARGATVIVDASASLRAGDQVRVTWKSPKGDDHKDKVVSDNDVGKALSVVFSSVLVNANLGELVSVSYQIVRVNGVVQDSGVYTVRVESSLPDLPKPEMDTVKADGIVTPGLIPDSGATVRVRYDARVGDQVKVTWRGAVRFEAAEQEAGSEPELVFNLPKALIVANIGAEAELSYEVIRNGIAKESERQTLMVRSALSFDTSAATLAGRVYLVPALPGVLPIMPPGTTLQRAASGGTPPYRYASSNPAVAEVSISGETSVRGKGTAQISVSDASGQSLSYQVAVTGVIECIGLGGGKFGDMAAAASNNRTRLPTIQELREIFDMWGTRWPLVKNQYWSVSLATVTPLGKSYYVKHLGGGGESDVYAHSSLQAIGIR